MSFPCLVSLASTGMSSLWGQVGKGVGSMLGEAVHIKLLPIKPPPIDSMLAHYLCRNDIEGLAMIMQAL